MDGPQPGQSTKPDPATAFAICLSDAVSQFETLLGLLRGHLTLAHKDAADMSKPYMIRRRAQFTEVDAQCAVHRSLALGFVFAARRAYRICDEGKSDMILPRRERKAFLSALKPLISVRNVNEHGYDPKSDANGDKSDPRLHEIDGGLLDETSIVISGPDAIYLGPLNLAEYYRVVAEVNVFAGFSALPQKTR